MSSLLRVVGEQDVVAFFLVLARLSPLFILAPLFSSKMVPARARAVIALALAVGLTPLALRGAHGPLPLDVLALVPLVLKELLIGLALGFAVGVVVAAVQTAGSFLDTTVGYAFAQEVDPITGNNSAVLSNVYVLVATMVFLAIGGDQWLVEGVARTYELVPVDGLPQLGPLVAGAEHAFAGVFVAALEVAAPVLIAAVLTDAAFGVVSRVVPQMNVFAVGFPAKAIVGLLVFAATLPFMGGWLADAVQDGIAGALGSIG